MVTLDKIVKKVPEFVSISQKTDYETAIQGLQLIKIEQEKFKESIKAETGYDMFNLPDKKTKTKIPIGDIEFEVTSFPKIKKPNYKDATEDIERHLRGYQFLINNGRTITGIAKEKNIAVIDVEKLLEECSIIVGGIMIPTVNYKIEYGIGAKLTVPEVNSIELKGRKSYLLSEKNAIEYVQLDKMKENLEGFIEKYESKIVVGGDGIKAVSDKSAYKTQKSESAGVDWAYVVKTLLQVRSDEPLGELDVLTRCHERINPQDRDIVSKYDVIRRTVNDERRLYVSIASVYDRIQELKDSETIISKRTKIESLDIV